MNDILETLDALHVLSPTEEIESLISTATKQAQRMVIEINMLRVIAEEYKSIQHNMYVVRSFLQSQLLNIISPLSHLRRVFTITQYPYFCTIDYYLNWGKLSLKLPIPVS